jgi:hypothetical protein
LPFNRLIAIPVCCGCALGFQGWRWAKTIDAIATVKSINPRPHDKLSSSIILEK